MDYSGLSKIKKQSITELMEDTFSILIDKIGKQNVSIIGGKLYITLSKCLITAEFTGTNKSLGNLTLSTITPYALIDQVLIPFYEIFKESKYNSNMDKLVNYRICGQNGEYSFIWFDGISKEDKESINAIVLKYIDTVNDFFVGRREE